MTTTITLDLTPSQPKSQCRGLFYRVERSAYVQGRGEYGERTRTRFLKRKSCPGCEDCERQLEAFQSDMGEGASVEINPLPDVQFPQPRLYQLSCVVTSTDWETGYADDWTWVFKEVLP